MDRIGKRILVLGGGAPNLTLMSGALLAFHDHGLTFDVITMAGAGAVVGLVYLAPRNLTPVEALRNTMNFGVSDAIYSLCPINFKMFSKGGALAEHFSDFWRTLPAVQVAEHQLGMSPAQKLESDWLLFAGAMMCPSNLSYFDQGLCAHIPFIEDLVDFDKLKTTTTCCYLNAYCIETKQIEQFTNAQIDVQHFQAALSFPYIYAPSEVNGHLFYEGAAFDCLNLIKLAHRLNPKFVKLSEKKGADPDKYVLLDVMKSYLIHPARNLWDAYAQSIIVPLVANAEKELALFQQWLSTGNVGDRVPSSPEDRFLFQLLKQKQKKDELGMSRCVPNADSYVVEFIIPPEQQPYTLDWSRSNLECLFDIGYESGIMFIEEYGNDVWAH
jgi:predicted acylesterase/phospholipase RssA